MKIGFIYNSLNEEGGVEKNISLVANEFVKNHEVYIFTFDNYGDIKYPLDSKINLITIEKKKTRKIRKAVKSRKVDILLAFSPYVSALAGWALLFSSIPVIGFERSGRIWKKSPFKKKVLMTVAGLTNARYLFLTNEGKKEYPKIFKSKYGVIPNPCEKIDYKQCEKTKTIISVGRLIKSKDYETLIKAFDIFHKSHPDYKLIILGEGPEFDNLQNYISSLNLSKYVGLLGHISNVDDYLLTSEFFVFTSLSEGMPNALIEAMSLGLPCIATNCKFGPSDLIQNGENGFLENMGDYENIAQKMCLLAENKELAHQISLNARKICETNSIENILEKYTGEIYKCLNKKSLKNYIHSYFFSKEWSVKYRKIDDKSIFEDTKSKFLKLPNTFRYWFGDPILFAHNNQTYLFLEAFDRYKNIGKIGCFKFDERKQKFTDFSLILDEPFHLSYPYVFELNGKIYMIPETRQASKIFIYECLEFPHKWERHVLINNISAVDSTVILDSKNELYLFTYSRENKVDYLEIYRVFAGDFALQLKEKIMDSDKVKRPAGPFVKYKDNLYRPSQYSTNSYGEKIIFNLVKSLDPFVEETDRIMGLDELNITKKLGVHTYSKINNIECIDIRHKERMLFLKKIIKKLRKY